MFDFRRKQQAYGLQILDHHVKLACITGASHRMKVQSTFTASIPDGVIQDNRIVEEEQLVQLLMRIARQLDIEGKPVTLTIPTSNVIIRRSSFASLKDEELRNLIDVELHGGGAQLPFKNPIFDFARIGKDGNQEDVIIFASPAEVVEQYVKVVRQAGLVPQAVDLAPLALFRVLCKYMKITGNALPRHFMMLNAESEEVEISIYKDGIPVFFRSIPIHTEALLDDDSDYLEAYARYYTIELGRIMNYYKYASVSADAEEIEHLFIIGDSHFVSGLVPALEKDFTGKLHALEYEFLPHARDADLQSYAVPIGLAMKGA